MAGPQPREAVQPSDAVATYKRVLADVIAARPSGTRQRLAAALTKNRSFISQITSPAYPTPIPASHIDIIFEICHFSADEKRRFLEAYGRAHPKRLASVHGTQKLKAHTIYLPDLGNDERNERLHTAVAEFVRQVVRIMEHEPSKQDSR